MEPGLAAKFPEIKTYRGQGIDEPEATARLDVTPGRFHGMILSPFGNVYIDPYSRHNDGHYITYLTRDYKRSGDDFRCHVHGSPSPAFPAPGDQRQGPIRHDPAHLPPGGRCHR